MLCATSIWCYEKGIIEQVLITKYKTKPNETYNSTFLLLTAPKMFQGCKSSRNRALAVANFRAFVKLTAWRQLRGCKPWIYSSRIGRYKANHQSFQAILCGQVGMTSLAGLTFSWWKTELIPVIACFGFVKSILTCAKRREFSGWSTG